MAPVALLLGTAALACGAGCSSAAGEPNAFGATAGGAGAGTGGASAGGAGTGGLVSTGGQPSGGSGGLTQEPPCAAQGDPNADGDGDGFTRGAGDCNDCTNLMNPGAYDYAGNAIDEDCSGLVDDEPVDCDAGLPPDATDPTDAARSLGLCRMQQGQSWGLIAARWVYPDGSTASITAPMAGGCVFAGKTPNPDSKAIVGSFGSVMPRAGSSMVSISSGVARPGAQTPMPPAQGQSPGGAMMCTASSTPPGFPKDSPSCAGVATANDKTALDGIALELSIKVPTNASSVAFDFDFYTFEWPVFVCTQFNDFFVALLDSSHASTPADGNVSFDSKNNPVSVNNGFVEVCDPAMGAQNPGGKHFPCALGTAELIGTGFEPDHAATSWLQTKASVVPGETISLRFAVWDMGDEVLDSTVLVDNLRWDVTEAGNPVTIPVPK
jgi:hypothetical protein